MLATGAGHGEAGDAPSQGPAREEVLSASPKSANPEKSANAANAISNGAPVIELASAKSKTVEAETRETGDLVTTRPKPEKRKNAKERAKAKFSKDKTAEDGTTPMTAKAKSEADLKKAERKAATKVAAKSRSLAAKAERKAKRTAAQKAA
jgi:hypothetical protein